MISVQRFIGWFVLVTALLAPVASTGCAARVRVYDQGHADYHDWNRSEDRAYRSYLSEKHENYRSFDKLDHNEQNDYWNWRHTHSDTAR